MTFNSELANKALDLIRLDPKHHLQGTWRCGSGQCYAGWTAIAAGVNWYTDDVADRYYQHVVVPDGFADDFSVVLQKSDGESVRIMHVGEFAGIALGIDGSEADVLFSASNSREEIERYIKQLENGEDITGEGFYDEWDDVDDCE